MTVKKVFKYGTGHTVPDGAVYMSTVVEDHPVMRLVWHYFLVEVEE